MLDTANNWESKTAIITTRNYNSGKMIPIKENIYQLSIAMVLRQNSYFTEVFNEVIFKLLSNGYISELYSNFENKKIPMEKSSNRLLAMNDVIGLFRVCLGGYILAVAIFGYEIISMALHKKAHRIKIFN